MRVWVNPWTHWREFARALLKGRPRVGAGVKENQHMRPTKYPRLRKKSHKQAGRQPLPASSKLLLEILIREHLDRITNVPYERSQF